MAIVNFSIPTVLNQRVTHIIKQKGFASKAEFFRFAAVHFLDGLRGPFSNEKERRHYLVDTLKREITARYKGKEFPTLEEQLADV